MISGYNCKDCREIWNQEPIHCPACGGTNVDGGPPQADAVRAAAARSDAPEASSPEGPSPSSPPTPAPQGAEADDSIAAFLWWSFGTDHRRYNWLSEEEKRPWREKADAVTAGLRAKVETLEVALRISETKAATLSATLSRANKEGMEAQRQPAAPASPGGLDLEAALSHLPPVGGRRLSTTLADFERKCRVHLQDLQGNHFADNSLIDTLCEAVRLGREHLDCVTSHIGWMPNPKLHGEAAPPPRSLEARPLDGGIVYFEAIEPHRTRCKHCNKFASDHPMICPPAALEEGNGVDRA